MTTYVPPKVNTAYKFYVGLVDQSNTKLLKANPTIAAGDFKVSTDGGAFGNLATLPSANPASGRAVMIDLSAGEMNGANIVVQCVDAAGAEWCDLMVNIQTSARQIDDLAFPTTSGRNMDIDASGGVEVGSFQAGSITNGAFAAGAIDNAAIAADAIGSSELAATAVNEIADGILARNISGGSSTGRTVKEALSMLRNKWTIVGGTLTVYDIDDTSVLWTGTLTGTAGADPITSSDPA